MLALGMLAASVGGLVFLAVNAYIADHVFFFSFVGLIAFHFVAGCSTHVYCNPFRA